MQNDLERKMNWKKVGVSRRGRVSEMGGNESKPTSNPSYNLRARSVPARTTLPPPVWPKNSTRWQKEYDVYICSSEIDISYAKALLAYLQEGQENLRCFLPIRDMNPGGAIPSEMTDGAENSHCWIMLMTSNFHLEPWCQYQMHQFLAMAPYGNGRLIPVLVELPFEHYPKELRHIYGFKDACGDQKVFVQIRRAIVSYLTKLPTVTTDQDPREETNSNTSESSPSSSLPGKSSQVISSQTVESISDTSVRSSSTQESSGDTSLGSSVAQRSTSIMSVRSKINEEATRDTALKCPIIQESANDMSESISSISPRSSTTQMTTNSTTVLKQETMSRASLKSSSYTQAAASDNSRRGSLNQEPTDNMSGRQEFAINMTVTGSDTQVPTCDAIRRSSTQESSSETCLKSCLSHTENYETLTSNTNTLTINCKESSTSTRISSEQKYATSTKVDSGSFSKEQTLNMDCQSSMSNIYPSSAMTMAKNKGTNSLQSNIYTSCGGGQVKKNSEMFPGDIYTSCCGTNTEVKNCLEIQGDIYTSCGTNPENKAYKSWQNNICISCYEAKTENKDSGSNICTCGGFQARKRDTVSLLSNIYTSSVRSKDVQILHKDRGTGCEETKSKKGGSESLLEDLYAGCGGMETQIEASPSYQSNIYTSCGRKQIHVDSQCLQTDMYTSFKGNQREKKTPCSYQSDLYTGYREPQVDLKNVQNLHGDSDARFGGLQTLNRPSVQPTIYMHRDGSNRPASEAADKT